VVVVLVTLVEMVLVVLEVECNALVQQVDQHLVEQVIRLQQILLKEILEELMLLV
jgi:hypothetical protein